jgi:hypothetical protein
MPLKRRLPKAKPKHSPLIQQLLDGDPFEHSDEMESELTAVVYFSWADGTPDAAIQRASAVLAAWKRDGKCP